MAITLRSHFVLLTQVLLVKAYLIGAQNSSLLQIFSKIYAEQPFTSLVIFQMPHQRCIEDQQLFNFHVPLMLLPANADCQLSNINKQMLVLHCLDAVPLADSALFPMVKCLGRMRYVPLLFYWHSLSYRQNRQIAVVQLRRLFSYCASNYLLNTVALFRDFPHTHHFYTYTHFPHFELQVKDWQAVYFPNRLVDMHGAALRTLPDQNPPRSILYCDDAGQLRIGGYVAKIVTTFAAKHNATLVYPCPVDPSIVYFYLEMQKMTTNGTLDIPMSMSSPVRQHSNHLFSKIVEQLSWRVMVPLSPPQPVSGIFLLIVSSMFGVTIVILMLSFSVALTLDQLTLQHWPRRHLAHSFFKILTDTALRGVLGVPTHGRNTATSHRRFLYTLLFLSGIFVSNTFTAYLKTFLTRPPRSQEIYTFDQLQCSSIKILISPEEYKTAGLWRDEFHGKYANIFQLTKSITDFYERRNTMDPRYAYTIADTLWPIFDRRQARSEHPTFHIPEQLYITKALYIAIPLHEHSIYRKVVNHYISQVQAAGLMQYWRELAYAEMEIAKLTHYGNIEPKAVRERLKVANFRWVWCIYGAGMMLGLIVFAVEIIRCKWSKKRETNKGIISWKLSKRLERNEEITY